MELLTRDSEIKNPVELMRKEGLPRIELKHVEAIDVQKNFPMDFQKEDQEISFDSQEMSPKTKGNKGKTPDKEKHLKEEEFGTLKR